MTKIEWLKLAIRDVKRHPDNAIKYINEVIELEALSKPSVVSEQSIYECLTETKGVVMTTDGDRRKFAKDVHKLITKGL